jgi:hypothetical protein
VIMRTSLAPTIPRLEAALSDGPLSTRCPFGHDLVFAPGWWCEDCARCVFPDLVRDCDDEPEDHD